MWVLFENGNILSGDALARNTALVVPLTMQSLA